MSESPEIRTVRLSAICESPNRTRVAAHGLSVLMDEPEERGGTGTALSPTETFMAALLGCVNVVLTNVAHREAVALRVTDVALEYDFDTRGVFGKADVAVPFTQARLYVTLRSDAAQDDLDRARMAYNAACPVTRMLRATGCIIHENWTVLPS